MEHAYILKTVTLRTPSALTINVFARQGLQMLTRKRNVLQVSFLETKYHHKKKLNKIEIPRNSKYYIESDKSIPSNRDFKNHS